MRVERLEAVGVCGFRDRVTVGLPKRGIVLVTGDNGSSKSSLIEIVPSSLWGKTLRGATPWVADTYAAHVVVSMGTPSVGVAATRERAGKGKATLSWDCPSKSKFPMVYESITHAQEALNSVVPSFDSWRRTCVFSSEDTFRFSTASDGDRKRFLEMALGLERLDAASELSRKELARAEYALAAANDRVVSEQATVDRYTQWLKDNPLEGPTEAVESRLQSLTGLVELLRSDREEVLSTVRDLEVSVRTLDSELARILNRKNRVVVDRCPSCEQLVPPDRKAALERELNGAEWATRGQLGEARTETDKVRDQSDVLGVDLSKLSVEADALHRKLADIRSLQRQRAQHAQWVGEAVARLEEAEKSRLAATQRHDLWSAVAHVYSLRGVRGVILSGALDALTHSANIWLARIAGPGVSLAITSSREGADGKHKESIGFELRGFGGESGYKAASQGQKRRVDVAMMIAISQIVSTDPTSTLWFDEVADSLDHDGITAMHSVLEELARDRCVVLITHKPELANGLRPEMRIHMEAGAVHYGG